MTGFKVHTVDTAPKASRPLLERARKNFGSIPNLFGVLAESPALLEAYQTLGNIFEKSSFDATERQIVLLTVSFENDCSYCVAAHSVIARSQGVPPEVIESLRNGTPLADARLESLRSLTAQVVRNRGWLDEDEVNRFLSAGFERSQILEVILGVGFKTLSNYVNHVSETPLDEGFQTQAWSKPAPLETSRKEAS